MPFDNTRSEVGLPLLSPLLSENGQCMWMRSLIMRVTNLYQEHTLSQLLQAESAYPTVVIVTNDHQNPSSDPAKKDLGKST